MEYSVGYQKYFPPRHLHRRRHHRRHLLQQKQQYLGLYLKLAWLWLFLLFLLLLPFVLILEILTKLQNENKRIPSSKSFSISSCVSSNRNSGRGGTLERVAGVRRRAIELLLAFRDPEEFDDVTSVGVRALHAFWLWTTHACILRLYS